MMKLKTLTALTLASVMTLNCGQKGTSAEVQTDNTTIEQASKKGTLPVEEFLPLDITSNNFPVEQFDIPDQFLTLIPNPAVPTIPGGFLGGLLGGLTGIGGGGAINQCSGLSSLLALGGTFLTGGNPFVGSLLSGLAGSLLNCGNQSSLLGLIPIGSSQSDQVFVFVSQLLNVTAQGQDPLVLLNAIKNPQDLNAVIAMLGTLSQQTQNADLQKLLNLALQFQGEFDGFIGVCGTMNAKACQVFQLINQIRGENGLAALIPNDKCVAASQFHSKDMLINKFLSHVGSNGLNLKQRLAQFGISGLSAENIVKGKKLSAIDAVSAWMNSEGHKKNILNPKFTSTGVGFIDGYFTQCFVK